MFGYSGREAQITDGNRHGRRIHAPLGAQQRGEGQRTLAVPYESACRCAAVLLPVLGGRTPAHRGQAEPREHVRALRLRDRRGDLMGVDPHIRVAALPGFEWTGNAWLYGLRLLVLALVCEVPYDCDVRQRVRHALAEPRVRPRGRADRARHTRPHVRMAHECAQGGAFGRCDHHRPAVGFHAVGRADATPHERRHCDARHVRDLLLPAFPREHDGVHGRHIRRGLRIDALLGCGGAHYRNDKLGYTHRWTRWAFYPVYPIMLVLCAAIGMAN